MQIFSVVDSCHYVKMALGEEFDEYEEIICMLLYQRIKKNKEKATEVLGEIYANQGNNLEYFILCSMI